MSILRMIFSAVLIIACLLIIISLLSVSANGSAEFLFGSLIACAASFAVLMIDR